MLKKLLNKQYNISFLTYSKKLSYFSFLLCILSVLLLTSRGLNKGIDFSGGILIEARFEKQIELKELRQDLIQLELGDISLQNLGNPLDIMIRIGLEQISEKAQLAKIATIKEFLNNKYEGSITYRRVDFVGPTVGKQLIKSGILALIFSFAAILLYIWIRFSYQYGIGAILALLHDVIIMFGFFSLSNLEFNLTSIAAILTIIGYSINDSVVIYDRIRENTMKYRSKKIADIINMSINETLNRTILTAITTIAALLSLAILGGPILKSFSYSVLFGVIIGTYSSIYIAASVVNNKKLIKKNNV